MQTTLKWYALFYIFGTSDIGGCYAKSVQPVYYLSSSSRYNMSFIIDHHMTDKPEVIYYFHDGESTDFTCFTENLVSKSYTKITYISKAGRQRSTDFQRAKSVSMYIKLTAAINDTVLECSVLDDVYEFEIGIRLRLVVRTDVRAMFPQFKVNGLILRQHQGTYSEYAYNDDGENLTVSVVQDNEEFINMTCVIEGKNVLYGLNNYFSLSLNKRQNGTSVACYFIRILPSERMKLNITLKFLLHTPNYRPYILGLRMSNILLSYSNYKGYHTIEYEVGNNPLSLHCVTTGRRGKWFYNLQKVIINKHNISGSTVQLKPDQNESIILCKEIFNYKREGYKKTFLILSRRVETTPTYQNLKLTSIEEPSTYRAVILLSILFVASVIVNVAVLVRCWLRRSIRSPVDAGSGLPSHSSPSPKPDLSKPPAPEHVYDEPYVLYPASKVDDVSQRPPYPLPPEVKEEHKRYRHYSTPYEHRIFRIGVPVLRFPDRFRSRRLDHQRIKTSRLSIRSLLVQIGQ